MNYKFLEDEFYWKHWKEIDAAFDKLGKYLPEITWEEIQRMSQSYVFVYDQAEDFTTNKPVYVIVTRSISPFQVVWIKIDENSPGYPRRS
jgi:hypothetical protein